LKTHEPSCVHRAAKSFFIPVAHSPSGVGGRGIRGSTRAHLVREARSGVEGHVAAAELSSTRERGPVPRDT
jgi:hypothetical protein